MSSSLKGGGYEDVECYSEGTEIIFLRIPNIYKVRNAFKLIKNEEYESWTKLIQKNYNKII
jgi:hypothetical protein